MAGRVRRAPGAALGAGLRLVVAGMLAAGAAGAQPQGIWVLDATSSRLAPFDAAAGTLGRGFSTPVFARPEGACGLACSGYSLYFVDATDPEQLIYEVSPRDGSLWNAYPAPAATVDGLAWDQGRLYATSFDEDRIYVLDAVHGTPLDTLVLDVDLAGGLAAGGGRLYAAGLRPGRAYVVDAASGALVDTLELPVDTPIGLAFVPGHLLAGDLETEQLVDVDPQSGALLQRWPLPGVRPAGLAEPGSPGPPPYALHFAVVGQEQLDTGQVEFALRAWLADQDGAVLTRNDRTPVELSVSAGSATWVGAASQRLQAGQVEARLRVPLGGAAEVRALVRGLDTASVSLGAAARTAALDLDSRPQAGDSTLLRLEARLLDPFGALAVQDTGACAFTVARGSAVVVGPTAVTPRQGVAATWVRLLRRGPEVVVRAAQGGASAEVHVAAPGATMAAAPLGGLAATSTPVAGSDERPPEPPGPVSVQDTEAQVVVTWEPSPADGAVLWTPASGLMVARRLLTGYRVLRQHGDSLFVEVGQVDAGVTRFSEARPAASGQYRYKVLSDDGQNVSEAAVPAGSDQDRARTLTVGRGTPMDAAGTPVLGLFGEDLTVGFDDFFLFADNFGKAATDPAFDALYDLDGSGLVDFDDFFIFVDYFGLSAVGYR